MNSSYLLLGLSYIFYLSYCYSSTPGLYIDRVSLFKPINSGPNSNRNYYNQPTMGSTIQPYTGPQHYTFQWRGTMPLPLVVSSAMSLHNYFINKATINRLISYSAELISNTAQTSISLEGFGPQAQFFIFSFNIIVITEQNNLIQLVSYSNTFSFLNESSRSSGNQTFFAECGFQFNQQTDIKVVFGIQWIKMISISVTSSLQGIILSAYGLPDSKLIRIDIQSHQLSKNQLHSFRITVLMIKRYDYQPNIIIYEETYIYDKFNGISSSNNIDANVPAKFGGAMGQNCILALFGLSRNITKPETRIVFSVNSSSKIYGIENQGNDFFQIKISCFLQCSLYNFIYEGDCRLCSQFIDSCVSCYSRTNCSACTIYTYLSQNHTSCIPCISAIANCQSCLNQTVCLSCSTGNKIIGGCSTVAGCIQTNKPDSLTFCSRCNQTQFTLNMTTNRCDCNIGRLVGKYCTLDPGCISTSLRDDRVICHFCNKSQLFIMDTKNQSCVCIDGFKLNESSKCEQICGDGRVFDLTCDDGNLIDGDGCSSDCRIQIFYRCINSEFNPSICQYLGMKIQITLAKIQKVQGINQAIFAFQFTPKLNNLAKLNLSNYFYFSCPNITYAVNHWSFSDGYAYLYLDYQSNIQGIQAQVNFTFDNYYVKHVAIPVTFQIASSGAKLLYYPDILGINPFCYYVQAISALACLLVLFGSFLHKMVGVEFIQTLQIIYYCHFTFINYAQQTSIYQYLGAVAFNDRFYNKETINVNLYGDYRVLSFSPQAVESSIIIVTCFFAGCIGISLLFQYLSELNSLKLQKDRLLMFKQKLIKNFAVPIALSLTYPLFLILGSLNSSSIEPSFMLSPYIRSVLVLCQIFFYSFLAFSAIVFKNNTKNQVEKIKQDYLTLYMLYLYLKTGSLWIWLRLGIFQCSYVLLFLFITQIIWQIIYKPYKRQLDNFAINLNLSLASLVLSYCILQHLKIIKINNQISDYATLAFISFITLCSIISISRLAISIKYKLRDKKQDKFKNNSLVNKNNSQLQGKITERAQDKNELRYFTKKINNPHLKKEGYQLNNKAGFIVL